ncbi:L-cystine-binding protein TcyA precursor [Metalysinibacillus saudimassiliensis]|uniref:L-cystine-binding protein TcyA n=1 Tax=Metalysinibacillus saudimassiliensis TaxID=1461583 RepID=A0A078LVU6_9BACL|nr:L-cystine-binding protein TcyA precursor [Metalysinibacillus saudimassiliensis]
MKKILVLLTALSVLLLAACGDQKTKEPAPTKDKLATIQESGTIKIGLEGAFPPFSYHDAKGTLTGFEYEIADQIAKDLGVKPEYIETKWDSLIAGLDVDKYDFVINNIAVTDERKEKYDFTSPYMKSNAVIAIHEDDDSIKKASDYKGKKSSQTVTSNFAQIARDLGAEIVPTEDLTKSIELVAEKRADGTIHDQVTFLTYFQEKPESPLKLVDEVLQSVDIAILLNQKQDPLRDEINAIIKKRSEDGTFTKISEKYFDSDIIVH